jgi:cell division protein FtsI/penicillin-binding protein 2/cell division protein FtsW (lipid II flippase)
LDTHLTRPRAGPQAFTLLLAPVVLLATAPLLVLAATGRPVDGELLLMTVALASLPAVTPVLLRFVGREWDPLLLAPVWMLCALGLAVVARVQPAILPTQMLWISVGWAAYVTLAGFPLLLPWLLRFRYVLLGGGLLLAVLTLALGDDVTGQGARHWLRVGPITMQPVELLRLLLITFLAGHLAERSPRPETDARARSPRAADVPLRSARDWLPIVGMFGVAIVIVLAQRDFGPSLIFVGSLVAMLYLATGRRDQAAAIVVAAAMAAVLIYLGSDRIQDRVGAWIDPWSDPRGSGYQSLQALGGLAFGGVFGTGPGYGAPGLIPAAHTDYPLAVIAEEWGLIGALAVVALYGLIITRAMARARSASTAFGQLLVVGLGVSLAVQVVVVFGGVLRLAPLTGLTSPFLSYGGSSMLVAWLMLALITSATSAPSASRPPVLPGVARRSVEVGLVMLAAFAVIALSLGYWQVVRSDLVAHPAVGGERLRVEETRVLRGRILDRNGAVMAETELGPDGTARRIYAAASAVHILGFNSANVGAMGVELVAADELMGRFSASPRDTWTDLLRRPRTGSDVQLTIDLELQRAAEAAMAGATGAVVAIVPGTGEILAMVSNPTFRPDFSEEEWERLRRDPASPLLNRATQGLYTPGSTFKTLTLAAAIEHGLVSLDTPASCPVDVYIEGVRIVSRNEPPGRRTQDMADAYAYSCNTIFAELGVALGADRIRDAAQAFGLTEEVPFDLPVVRGSLSNTPQFLASDAGLAATSFGQGELQFTPLHLALMTAAIANDGVVPVPRLFRDDSPEEWRRAVSPETARAVRAAMEHGVEVGWASVVATAGARVAGKTGSAEVVEGESSHALFIAFAPADAPEIAVAVVKERAGSGSREAGPVARAVIEAWLGILERQEAEATRSNAPRQ